MSVRYMFGLKVVIWTTGKVEVINPATGHYLRAFMRPARRR